MPLADAKTGLEQTASRRAMYRPLSVGLVVALLSWAFIVISGEMVDGDTRGFDIAIWRAAQTLRIDHPWLTEVMRDLSGLGSTAVLTLFTAVAVGYLSVVRERPTALLLATAVITGSVLVSLLKSHFARIRPDADGAVFAGASMSFPSGHAANSAIVFLTVAALLASSRWRPVEQMYIVVIATWMSVLVGLSRIALGVHWATDVAAGWALGAAWALACLLLTRKLLLTGSGTRRDVV